MLWARDLRRLTLNTLELETELTLLPGGLAEEEELVNIWLTGKRHPSGAHVHPTLKRIILRYRTRYPLRRVMSVWECAHTTGQWVRHATPT